MVKECLREITNNRYKDVYENIIFILENYEEYQIEYALVNGISLNDNIVLQKYQNGPFNCFNRDRMMVGNLPICRLIETKLNQKMNILIFS